MRFEGFVIYQNNNVKLVNDACKLCYNGKEEIDLAKQLRYIEGKIKVGHESVIEHSNIVILMIDNYPDTPIEKDEVHPWIEFADAAHYVHLNSKKGSDGRMYHLIGGSIRGLKMIIRQLDNQYNLVGKALLSTMHNLHKEYFFDFIQAGIMNYAKFTDSELIISRENLHKIEPVVRDQYTIDNIDNIEFIKSELDNMIGEPLFSYDALMDMGSITVFFTKMARIISQQVTRHRNAISQESQRYVDSRGIDFVNPLQFKDNYDTDKIYHTEAFGDVTVQELGEKMSAVYAELREQGMEKEDARYFLPQGLNTRLYMTFTLRHFIKFLELRIDPHAQAEIRDIANQMLQDAESHERTKELFVTDSGSKIFEYLQPKYMEPAEVDIDEIVE